MPPIPIPPSPAFGWWAFALRGVIALAFGALALTLPTATVLLITLGFGAYAFVDGLLTLVAGLRRAREGGNWGWMVLAGVAGLAAGTVALAWPPAASLALSAFLWSVVALWTLLVGAVELAAAARLRRLHAGMGLLGLRGALAMLLGLALIGLMAWRPMASLLVLGRLVGLAFLGSGLVLLALAFRLRHAGREPAPLGQAR